MNITLPDGSIRQFDGPVTGAQVAESIGAGLLRAAVAVTVDGREQDLSVLITEDASVSILTVRDEAGLDVMRHTIAAQVLARAAREMFPGAKLAIGPTIEHGFYYDIEFTRPLSDDDLPAIETRMKEIVKEKNAIEMRLLPRADAIQLFKDRDEPYKVDIIERAEGQDDFQIYFQDGSDFVDLCRGPHLPNLSQIGAFKLTKVAGAYWRGDSSNQMLTRIYGTAFSDKKALKKHLNMIAEAEKRDHRVLGKQLELIMFHDYAPGAPFFLPKGEVLYHELSEAMRSLLVERGDYKAVRTPQLFDSKLWKTSGHWDHYADNMYAFGDDDTEEEGEQGRVMGLKPMNCPSHMLIFGAQKRSYRELPLRLHDQGVLHRNELRGVLGGLTRVRQFCQDDAHLFVTPEQIEPEVTKLLAMVGEVYSAFGMTFKAKLSTRPAKKLGDDALWDQAETSLENALVANELDFQLKPGDGAFYGPKIDFDVVDALGREWQCATIQLDYQLPERFELKYTGSDNEPHTPIVIHRAIFGSLERFIAILIEHYAGAFPTWISPEQVRLMTVSEKSLAHGQAVKAALEARGLRVHLDHRDDKIGFKIREAHNAKVPWMAILGEQEMESQTVSLRLRGDLRGKGYPEHPTVEEFVTLVATDAVRPF
ncbi:MAG: threonine--tRNA ligase [Myxococcota bacterium]